MIILPTNKFNIKYSRQHKVFFGVSLIHVSTEYSHYQTVSVLATDCIYVTALLCNITAKFLKVTYEQTQITFYLL